MKTDNYKNIPEELRSLPQWVGFLRTPGKNGKMNKLPVNPHSLYGASSTNPETWGTFKQALSIIGKHCKVGQTEGIVEGIGFVFAPPYCGIDLDHVIDENGEVNRFALDIVNNMKSYTEKSPSGTGLHIIYKGSVHPEWKKKQVNALGENTDLEMYQTGRYFTVTGNVWGGYREIIECDAVAECVQIAYMSKSSELRAKSSEQKNFTEGGGTAQDVTRGVLPQSPALPQSERKPLNDSDILAAAMNSKNGMLFSDLYAGKWQGRYGSQSEADMAFCAMLAFWFQRDFNRMDAVFRKSGLMRDKWDREQSGSTYGALTLQKAISECTDVYKPYSPDDNSFSITIKSRGHVQKYYTFDDTGNAQRLYDMFGDRIRYNYTDKKWMIYDRNKWTYDMTGYILKLIDKAMDAMELETKHYEEYDKENGTDMLKDFEKHMKKCRNNNTKKALEKEVQHYAPVTPNELDRHKLLLNTPSGVIDLQSFKISQCSPDYYFTKTTSVSRIEGAECPLWMRFLNDIFGGDQELIHYVQKAAGYSLSGLTDEQCAFFCYGTGRNGKTTFLDIIRCIAGDYASNIQPETLMVKGVNQGVNTDIARLKGARFVTSVEPNEGLRLNEGLLKQLTGDDVVTARKLYAEEFEFKPEFKLWMATNHKPIIRGTDTGIWRRIHLIPFTVQIPEKEVDRKLKDKLMQEIEGIFLWCLEGLRMYNEEGLEKPDAVIQATADYKQEMDTISKFLDECTVPSFAGSVKAKDLYNVYTKWCDDNGEYKLTNTKFGQEIQKRFERKRNNSGYFYSGIVFSNDYEMYKISIKE